jgi:hypothetical protein
MAAVSGFGIGSPPTPLLAPRRDQDGGGRCIHPASTEPPSAWRRAQASIARCRGVSATSAACGPVGALLNARAPSPALTVVPAVVVLA